MITPPWITCTVLSHKGYGHAYPISTQKLSPVWDEDALTIRGEKKEEQKEERENYYHVERSFGSFHRTIPLPTEVEEEKAEATFKKGVLTVTLPKVEAASAKKKQIKVKTE